MTSSKKTACRQPPMPHAQTEQHGLKCVASLALLYVVNFAQLVFPQMTRKNSRTARFHPSVEVTQRTQHGLSRNQVVCSDAVPLTSPWFVRSDLSKPAQCEGHILSPLWWTTRVGMVTLPSQREPPIVIATNLRNMSPATMPRTPPVGFLNAVSRQNRNAPRISHGTSGLARPTATSCCA